MVFLTLRLYVAFQKKKLKKKEKKKENEEKKKKKKKKKKKVRGAPTVRHLLCTSCGTPCIDCRTPPYQKKIKAHKSAKSRRLLAHAIAE